MIAVNKSVDEQSPAESERYTLDQFIDDHIRENFKISNHNKCHLFNDSHSIT